jgi:hypothetical protein
MREESGDLKTSILSIPVYWFSEYLCRLYFQILKSKRLSLFLLY